MTTNPIFDALVAEQKFDPTTVTPIPTETERTRAHKVWQEAAAARCFRDPLPVKVPAKKRAVKKGSAA